jgi:hypothetical protein
MMQSFDYYEDDIDRALYPDYGILENVVEALRMLPRVLARKVVVRWDGQGRLWDESDERWRGWGSLKTREEFLRQIGRLNGDVEVLE